MDEIMTTTFWLIHEVVKNKDQGLFAAANELNSSTEFTLLLFYESEKSHLQK